MNSNYNLADSVGNLEDVNNQTVNIDNSTKSTQITSTNFSFNVKKVRHSRIKIENDVLKMQTRIQLLQAEEDRALKVIEEARQKAEQILTNRQNQLKFKEELNLRR